MFQLPDGSRVSAPPIITSNNIVIVGLRDGGIIGWNLNSQRLCLSLDTGFYNIKQLLVHPRENTLYFAAASGELSMETETNGAIVIQSRRRNPPDQIDHPVPVYNIQFSKRGHVSISTYGDGVIRIHRPGGKTRDLSPPNLVDSVASALSPDGRRVAALYGNRKLIIWNTKTGRIENTYAKIVHRDSFSYLLKFSPSGQFLIIGSASEDFQRLMDYRFQVWRLTPKSARKVWEVHQLRKKQLRYLPFVFSANEKRLAIGNQKGTVQLHDVSYWDGMAWRFKPTSIFDTIANGAIRSEIIDLKASPDWSHMVANTADGDVVIWYPRSAHRHTRINAGEFPLRLGEFSPDGSYLALHYPSSNHYAKVDSIH